MRIASVVDSAATEAFLALMSRISDWAEDSNTRAGNAY